MLVILQAILLGIVQGITEWLPISSTGHMILVNALWPLALDTDFVNLFLVVIQFGSILAVIVLYFKKLLPFGFGKTKEERKDTWALWAKIIVAVIPAGVAGVLFDDVIDGLLYGPTTVAIALIVYGILFIALENRKAAPRVSSLRDLSFGKALGIGLFQMLALIPGTSRSGSTILGAVWLGCSRPVAAEFSFFLAVPVMFGASAYKIYKYLKLSALGFSAAQLAVLGTGMITAFIVSVIAIRFLVSYIQKHDFKIFGWYRIFLGLAVLAYFIFLR